MTIAETPPPAPARGPERLLQPARLDRFCPAIHCARACGAAGAEPCTCLPCRHCPDCDARTARARRGQLSGPLTTVRAFMAQPRLFPVLPDPRSRS